MKKAFIVLLLALVLVSTGWADEVLKRYTTYETALTNEDIMTSFVNEVNSYLRKYGRGYCLVSYEVYQDKDEQNYAWATSTRVDDSLEFSIYTIKLQLSNAHFNVKVSNKAFSTGGQPAKYFDSHGIIRYMEAEAEAMFTESSIVLKMYGKSYTDSLSESFAKIIRKLSIN
ncbi:MAG: hypothetical protein Ta2A_19000 [Treponemataceae bacterium]|nr:MAG: hypothetical protein Ta2A_19000 [Treponemataceae bacterium]